MQLTSQQQVMQHLSMTGLSLPTNVCVASYLFIISLSFIVSLLLFSRMFEPNIVSIGFLGVIFGAPVKAC